MSAETSISISKLPSWLISSEKEQDIIDEEFTIETSYLHKTGKSGVMGTDHDCDFGLKILDTFSLASEKNASEGVNCTLDSKRKQVTDPTLTNPTPTDALDFEAPEIDKEFKGFDDVTEDYSVFCSKELDHLLAAENIEFYNLPKVEDIPTNIRYNVPTKQAGYVKTLQDALNKSDHHTTICTKSPLHPTPVQNSKRKRKQWNNDEQQNKLQKALRSSNLPMYQNIKVDLLKSMADLYTLPPITRPQSKKILQTITKSVAEFAVTALHKLELNNTLLPFVQTEVQCSKPALYQVNLSSSWKSSYIERHQTFPRYMFLKRIFKKYKVLRNMGALSRFAHHHFGDLPVVLSKTDKIHRWKVQLKRHKIRWQRKKVGKDVVMLPLSMHLKKRSILRILKPLETYSAARLRTYIRKTKNVKTCSCPKSSVKKIKNVVGAQSKKNKELKKTVIESSVNNEKANMECEIIPHSNTEFQATKGIMILKFHETNPKESSNTKPFYIKVLSECDWSSCKNNVLLTITQAHNSLKKTHSGKYTCSAVGDFCVEGVNSIAGEILKYNVPYSIWKSSLPFYQPVTLIRVSHVSSPNVVQLKAMQCSASITDLFNLDAKMSEIHREGMITGVFDVCKPIDLVNEVDDIIKKTPERSPSPQRSVASPHKEPKVPDEIKGKTKAFKLGTLGCINSKVLVPSTAEMEQSVFLDPKYPGEKVLRTSNKEKPRNLASNIKSFPLLPQEIPLCPQFVIPRCGIASIKATSQTLPNIYPKPGISEAGKMAYITSLSQTNPQESKQTYGGQIANQVMLPSSARVLLPVQASSVKMQTTSKAFPVNSGAICFRRGNINVSMSSVIPNQPTVELTTTISSYNKPKNENNMLPNRTLGSIGSSNQQFLPLDAVMRTENTLLQQKQITQNQRIKVGLASDLPTTRQEMDTVMSPIHKVIRPIPNPTNQQIVFPYFKTNSTATNVTRNIPSQVFSNACVNQSKTFVAAGQVVRHLQPFVCPPSVRPTAVAYKIPASRLIKTSDKATILDARITKKFPSPSHNVISAKPKVQVLHPNPGKVISIRTSETTIGHVNLQGTAKKPASKLENDGADDVSLKVASKEDKKVASKEPKTNVCTQSNKNLSPIKLQKYVHKRKPGFSNNSNLSNQFSNVWPVNSTSKDCDKDIEIFMEPKDISKCVRQKDNEGDDVTEKHSKEPTAQLKLIVTQTQSTEVKETVCPANSSLSTPSTEVPSLTSGHGFDPLQSCQNKDKNNSGTFEEDKRLSDCNSNTFEKVTSNKERQLDQSTSLNNTNKTESPMQTLEVDMQKFGGHSTKTDELQEKINELHNQVIKNHEKVMQDHEKVIKIQHDIAKSVEIIAKSQQCLLSPQKPIKQEICSQDPSSRDSIPIIDLTIDSPPKFPSIKLEPQSVDVHKEIKAVPVSECDSSDTQTPTSVSTEAQMDQTTTLTTASEARLMIVQSQDKAPFYKVVLSKPSVKNNATLFIQPSGFDPTPPNQKVEEVGKQARIKNDIPGEITRPSYVEHKQTSPVKCTETTNNISNCLKSRNVHPVKITKDILKNVRYVENPLVICTETAKYISKVVECPKTIPVVNSTSASKVKNKRSKLSKPKQDELYATLTGNHSNKISKLDHMEDCEHSSETDDDIEIDIMESSINTADVLRKCAQTSMNCSLHAPCYGIDKNSDTETECADSQGRENEDRRKNEKERRRILKESLLRLRSALKDPEIRVTLKAILDQATAKCQELLKESIALSVAFAQEGRKNQMLQKQLRELTQQSRPSVFDSDLFGDDEEFDILALGSSIEVDE
uniref:Uncharacterized protein LOC101242431 n=1 Tax=Phallusia mammillata TaxID=59560 RepID=A0A6F9DJC6_9ASCI|nr:uncharacterized protein LOC101242431 [Phallusia mammillata]